MGGGGVNFTIHKISAKDGVELGVLEWRSTEKKCRNGEKKHGLSSQYPYPILLIHGYAQNNLSWHGRSGGIADKLACDGFHIFAVDLRGSGYSRLKSLYYDFTFEDFVFKDLDSVIGFISELAGTRKVVLAGHSLGGIVSYAYASWKPDKVHAIITFGSPVYFGDGVPIMRFFGKMVVATRKIPLSKLVYLLWPRENFMKILGFLGLFGVPMMRSKALLKIAPLYPSYTRNFESMWDFWEKLVLGFDFSSPRLFFQILRWAGERKITSFDGSINFTEEFKKINQPIFVIAGKLDKLAPPLSVKPILEIVSSDKKVYREYEAGHIDIIEGKLAKEKVAPDIVDFLMNLV